MLGGVHEGSRVCFFVVLSQAHLPWLMCHAASEFSPAPLKFNRSTLGPHFDNEDEMVRFQVGILMLFARGEQ